MNLSMNKTKICVVTGSRADYGLLHCLMKSIEREEDFQLQVIATGMHLSTEFGLTYKEIEWDNFKIDRKIEILLSADTSSSISKSTGLGLIGFADAYKELNSDIVIVLGDRYEIFAASIAALFARIPIAHLHGGETTTGAFDEAIRHGISKMATWHFVAAEPYRKRVIQLGENPDHVITVGGLGVERLKMAKLFDRIELQKGLKFKFGEKNLLITYHPVTLEGNTAEYQFRALLDCLDDFTDTHMIFTKSNSDTEGRIINELIDEFVIIHPDTAISFISMGTVKYLSSMQYVDAVVGNSSSGIIEAPSFKIATINIGDRQRGRLMAESIVNCDPTVDSIRSAFKTIYSPYFKAKLNYSSNPYEKENTSRNIVNYLKCIEFPVELKKDFYDL